jgi:EmrB/QacA subfamily drug resistance transporter
MATTQITSARGEALDREVLVLGGVVVAGTITAILDATIVNVAIPTLGREFDASVATLQWVMTAYLLAFASVIPLSGWATARFGARQAWMGALCVFLAGSVLAGTAWSIEALVVFRVVQGLGAGLLMPVGQTILARAAGPERMGRVMSVVGVPMLLAPVFGPVLGGAIVDLASWRWIFFVNVPVVLVALALAHRLLPRSEERGRARLDVRGLALLSPGLAIFVYGMSEAGAAGGLGDPRVLGGVALGIVLVVGFVVHARARGRSALIDVSLFSRRGFAAAAGTNLAIGIALFGALILLPLYFQLVRGESALATGLLLVPQGVGAALAMPIAGRLTDKAGARLVIPAGILLALIGTAALTAVGANTPYALLGAALFVIGLGLGATIVPSMAVAYRSVPRAAVPQATSTINIVQRVAGSIGTALLAVVLQRELATRAGGGVEAIAGLSEGARAAAPSSLADAFGTAFSVAFALLVVALVPALLLPGTRSAADSSDEPSRAETVEHGDRRAA